MFMGSSAVRSGGRRQGSASAHKLCNRGSRKSIRRTFARPKGTLPPKEFIIGRRRRALCADLLVRSAKAAGAATPFGRAPCRWRPFGSGRLVKADAGFRIRATSADLRSISFTMEIAYASLSTAGPVRPHNEDCIAFWQPTNGDESEWRGRGALVVLADGVGGQERGEVASRMACDAAVEAFTTAKPGAAPNQVLFQMFNAANIAVYDANLKNRHAGGKMATTLTACIYRHNEVTIGHVGDCRVYLVQQGRIRRVTNDHSYAGVQLKLGLVTAA